MLRMRTIRSGEAKIQGTRGHAADAAASAVAVDVTRGLKGLAVLVADAIDFAGQVFPS